MPLSSFINKVFLMKARPNNDSSVANVQSHRWRPHCKKRNLVKVEKLKISY